jgi:hypothetical protein
MRGTRVFRALSLISLLLYLIFIFYAPLLQNYYPVAKKVFFYAALLFITFSFLQRSFRSNLYFLEKRLIFFVLGFPVCLIIINLFFNTGGISEISTFISIYFVLAAVHHARFFLAFLHFSIIVNFLLLSYEFLSQKYIYEDLYNMSGELTRSLDIASYGDIGFRPKGLFAGPLDATSFIILSALICRNRFWVLNLCFASALLSNGRLAMLVCAVLIISRYNLSMKAVGSILVSLVAMLVFFTQFQESAAVMNLLAVFDFTSPSNVGRIIYTFSGIEHLLRVDFFSLLLGSSVLFLDATDGHSAESGIVSMIISHGLLGLTYLMVLFLGFSNSLKREYLVLMLALACLSIYRIDVGFMRSFLLYFLLIYASKEAFHGHHR